MRQQAALALGRLDSKRGIPPLIDVLLPDMMGYHVGEGLRAGKPGLPLLFMSGVFKGSKHSTEALTRFPGSKFFEKPFDAKQLLEAVKILAPVTARTPESRHEEEPFDVELDIDVDDEGEAMELTGTISIGSPRVVPVPCAST